LFSGPIQFSDLESQNTITVEIEKNDTSIRLYAEQQGITFTLKETFKGKVIATGSGSSLHRKLSKGHYQIAVGHSTTHARKSAAYLPPRTQLSITVADPDI
jgi:hypothetical protein